MNEKKINLFKYLLHFHFHFAFVFTLTIFNLKLHSLEWQECCRYSTYWLVNYSFELYTTLFRNINEKYFVADRWKGKNVFRLEGLAWELLIANLNVLLHYSINAIHTPISTLIWSTVMSLNASPFSWKIPHFRRISNHQQAQVIMIFMEKVDEFSSRIVISHASCMTVSRWNFSCQFMQGAETVSCEHFHVWFLFR